MKIYVTISFLATVLTGFMPVNSAPSQDAGQIRYAKCLDMADRSPDRAINLALVWKGEGGGVPARHCEAVGLSRLGEYAEAAIRLEMIATDMRVGKDMPIRAGKRLVGTSAMLADMYGQAANAWLLGGQYGKAEAAIQFGLSLAGKNSKQETELLLDRARIAAADHDFEKSLADLETIYKRDTRRQDILVLLASSARLLGKHDRALEAITEYIDAFPDDVSGHLEHGNLLDAMGKPGAARKSWLKVLTLTAVGTDADAARANIERMDVHKPVLDE